MGLSTPESVQKLQAALHAKAKGSPGYRFYTVYEEVYRQDVLAFAYRCCRANGGAPGVDNQNFTDIESYGLERWLGELAGELRNKTYRPQAVRRVWIPKPDGKQRPLGIPTVKDRVVQMATLLVLEPFFEADLQPEQYAYRPQRSALDADLSGYFDSIPHTELMKAVARRLSDRHMLHLIKRWLQMPVEEKDGRGQVQRTTRNKDEHRGTPQGAPISPLLSNLYMGRFVLGWKTLGHAERLKAEIVNYADDFVICCRCTADEAMRAMRDMMDRLKLTVNETKTRICRLPDESFDFLGYSIGHCWSPRTGRAYIGTRPSRKRVRRLCETIHDMTSARWGPKNVQDRVDELNRVLRGWANYFCLGPVGPAYRAIDRYVRYRVRQWLRRKHQQPGRAISRWPDTYLNEKLGLLRLAPLARTLPWAKA